MADDERPGGDRTEAASPRRLERAREAGQVPLSREAVLLASLSATTVVLGHCVFAAVEDWCRNLIVAVAHAGSSSFEWEMVGAPSELSWITLIWPPLVAASLSGAIGVLIQTNFSLRLQALTPHWSRVNPVTCLRRILSTDAWIESGKSAVKLLVLMAVLCVVVGLELIRVRLLPLQSLYESCAAMANSALRVLYAGCAVQGLFAAVDVIWVRYKHDRGLRMSKQEIRDEFKETEGSPHIKAKVRQVIFARSRRRMMSQVATATVVVTNPTHYAVALIYDRARNAAPRVVAKGVDQVATKIREIAAASSIPVVANPPLARALHRLDLDTEIPSEYFKAVAQIIAYVWRLRRERPRIL